MSPGDFVLWVWRSSPTQPAVVASHDCFRLIPSAGATRHLFTAFFVGVVARS